MAMSKKDYEKFAWEFGRALAVLWNAREEEHPCIMEKILGFNVAVEVFMNCAKDMNWRFDKDKFRSTVDRWRDDFLHSYNHREPLHRKGCNTCKRVDSTSPFNVSLP